MIKNIFFKIKKFFKRLYQIDCTIQTPQFNPDGSVYKIFRQSGTFNIWKMKFEPFNLTKGHSVQFHKMKDFIKAVIKNEKGEIL